MKRKPTNRKFWIDEKTTSSEAEIRERAQFGNPGAEDEPPFAVIDPHVDFDRMVQNFRLTRKVSFVNSFLDKKLTELGREKFERKREKLAEKAEKVFEENERRIREAEEKEERDRKKRLAEERKRRQEALKWEDPTVEFLEQHLFESKAERERTLTYYKDHGKLTGEVFKDMFYRLILQHLDRSEGRKLKD